MQIVRVRVLSKVLSYEGIPEVHVFDVLLQYINTLSTHTCTTRYFRKYFHTFENILSSKVKYFRTFVLS